MAARMLPITNAKLAVLLVGIAAGMVGMAYAAVPLYDLFCRVTGYGGTTQRADAATGETLDRTVVVRFDANVLGLPWTFRPERHEVTLKVGETALVHYVAQNNAEQATAGSATFNVAPNAAGAYFNKIDCFCFTRQEIGPGETVRMPVQFFVSPDLDADRELDGVRAITLSYTFFPDREAGQPVARSAADGPAKNL